MGFKIENNVLVKYEEEPGVMEDFFALQEKIKEICPETYL